MAGGVGYGRATDARKNPMKVLDFAHAAWQALTAPKDSPSLYDLCDPVFLNHTGSNPHIVQFYKTALGNSALRMLLRRTGLPELRDPDRFRAVQQALIRARDDADPDWAAIGGPVADLLDTVKLRHPSPAFQPASTAAPDAAAIDQSVENRCRHVDRMPAGQSAAATASGGPDGIDDIGCGLGHFCSPERFRFRKGLNSGPISNQC